MNKNETTIKSKYIYYGNVLKLRVDDVRLSNNKESKREIVEHGGAVCVLALTTEGEVLLVKQYRHPFNKVLLELPAGKIDKGETHFEAAKREFYEETGIEQADLTYLGEIYPSVGYTTEVIHLYYIKDVKLNKDYKTEEINEVVTYSLEDLLEMIISNNIHDAKTICAILKYKLLNEKNQK